MQQKDTNSTFLQFSDSIRETLTDNDISQIVKVDLQRIQAWFIIDCFVHNIDLISTASNSFRPQTSDDKTISADQTDYLWDPFLWDPLSVY